MPTIITAFGPDRIGLRIIPFGVATIAYLVALPLHWAACRPSEIRLIGNATAYSEEWLQLDEVGVLKLTLIDLSQAQTENERALETKKRQTHRAALAVAVQVSFLVVGILTVAV